MSIVMTMVAIAMLSVAMSEAGVTGVWDLEMRWSGDRQSTGVCTFEQKGRTLAGTCGGSDKFAVTGDVDDRRLTWRLDVEQNGSKGRMMFSGEVDEGGTTIKGTCRILDGQDGTFTMKKQSGG